MRFTTSALVGGLAAVASASQLNQRFYKSVWCDDQKTVTETVTVTAGGDYSNGPAPTQPPVWTEGGAITSVEYSTSSGTRYTTVQVWPTGSGKKDCTRVVYEGSKQIKVEVIVIVVVIGGDKPVISTDSTKSESPSSIPPPITYTPAPPATVTKDTENTASPTASPSGKVFDVELRNDNGTLHYVPDHVEAKVGDVVNFVFRPKAHSVTQSTFDTPCTFNGGFDTGLTNGSADGSVSRKFMVTDVSKPLWFYCRATQPVNHCGAGMVFGINPGDKMDEFIARAKAQNGPGANATTSVTSSAPISTSTGYPPASGYPKVHKVIVSGGINVTAGVNTLKYDPPFFAPGTLAPRDILEFDFRALNHTVTESTLASPCTKKSLTAFDTNFQNFNKDNIEGFTTASFTVPDNDAHYFYCRQAKGLANEHCGNGMVFAINVDMKQFEVFEQNAENSLAKPMTKA